MMSETNPTLVDIHGCGTVTADDFLNYRMEVHDGLFEAEGLVDVPLTDNERIGVVDEADFYSHSVPALGFQTSNGILTPNITYTSNNLCQRYEVCISRDESDSVTPFGAEIFGGATVIGVRAGDLNGDGFFDVVYDTQDADQNLKSFILYQQPFNTEMSRDDLQIWEASFVPVLNSHLQVSQSFPRDLADRLHHLFFLLKDMREQGHAEAASHIRSMLIDLATGADDADDADDLKAIDTYIDMIETYHENPDLLETLKNVGKDYTTPLAFFEAVKNIAQSIGSGENLTSTTELFQLLYHGIDNEDALRTVTDLAIKIGQRLSQDEINALIITMKFKYEADQYKPWIENIRNISGELQEISAENDPRTILNRLYTLVGGPASIQPLSMAQYAPLRSARFYDQGVRLEDLVAAEESIGASGALLLWEKFGVLRFGRYHSTILQHLVEMASDANHDREKPLVLAVVASYDHSDMFYWGKNFQYDPNIRMVVLEVKNLNEFKENAWRIREEYGIPDVVFITAHGTPQAIQLGMGTDIETSNEDYFTKSFTGFFGDKDGQIVLNSCSTGASMPEGEINFAQMVARAFNAVTIAPRAVEALLDITVQIDSEHRARLIPTYLEIGSEFFGFNPGGMTFYPDQEPVYRHVVDTNTGWQPSAFLSLEDSTGRLGGGFGYSHQIYDRLRFRYDLLTDYNTSTGAFRFYLGAEAAVGLTNQLMFGIGVRGGLELESEEQEDLFIQEYAAFKLAFPSVNVELDLGVIDDDWTDPSFFGQLMYRF